MVFIYPADNGVLGAFHACNNAGSVIAGRLVLDPNGSGETKFLPDNPKTYDEFLKEDRQHEAGQKTTPR